MVLLIILSFFLIKPFLEALLVGVLLAYFTFPLYKLLDKKLSSTLSSLLVCLLVLLLMVIPTFFLVKFLVNDSYSLLLLVKERVSTEIFSGCNYQICSSIEGVLQHPSVAAEIQSFTQSLTTKIFERGSQFLFSIPSLILNLFVMFFTLFYFLKNGNDFLSKINHYLSMQKKEYSRILSRLKEIVHGVVYGYLMVAGIQGALGALGFWIFGVSSPLLWGLIMGLFALIPILGTGVIWVPAALILFLNGLTQNSNLLIFKGAGLFLYGLLIVSTIDNILRPKLIGDRAKIHPLIILLGVFGGLLLFGPLGVIIGPLVISITFVIAETYLSKKV